MVSGQGTFDCDGHHQRGHSRGRRDRAARDRVCDPEGSLARTFVLALGLFHHRGGRIALDCLVDQKIFSSGGTCRPGHRRTGENSSSTESDAAPESLVPIIELLRFRETWGIVVVKFLTDAAWYFYIFWLPKYLLDARGFDIKGVGATA